MQRFVFLAFFAFRALAVYIFPVYPGKRGPGETSPSVVF
jgi:hypothetical protein